MRPTKLVVSLALALAALGVLAALLAIRRPAPRPAPGRSRDAGGVADAGRADAAVDAPAPPPPPRRPRPDAGPPPPVGPRQRELDNQRRDAVAAQVQRDLLQRGHRVEAVRAVEAGGGFRSQLRVQGAACGDAFNRTVARTYPLRAAGYTLVTCTRPDTGDTFVTAVAEEPTPPVGADRDGARPDAAAPP
jgi:hypothetical protein